MHFLFFNKPWIIDQSDYNCSMRTEAEWLLRGSVNEFQGIYFLTSGTFFVAVYSLALIAMMRGNLTKSPCYSLMFFNGIVDLMDLLVGSLMVAYFHFTGAVYCSSVIVNWITGHFGWSLTSRSYSESRSYLLVINYLGVWIGSTFSCTVLALNRVAEMVPAARRLRFLFQGRMVYMWMCICLAIMVIRPFVTRPLLYNSTVSAYLTIPVILDDIQWEVTYYTSFVFPIHNISSIVVIATLNIVLCTHVAKMKKRKFSNSIDKIQIQLFVQTVVICSSITVSAILYVFIEFVAVPRSVVILTNVTWQLSHGMHGIVYISLNKRIRKELRILFGCYKQQNNFFRATSTINTGAK